MFMQSKSFRDVDWVLTRRGKSEELIDVEFETRLKLIEKSWRHRFIEIN